MIQWLSDNSGAMSALLTFAIFVVTYLYVRYTKNMVKEMQRQRLDAAMPVLSAVWGAEECASLVLRNDGQGTALWIRVKIECWRSRDSKSEDLYACTINALGPNSQFELPVDQADILGDQASLRLSYRDLYSRRFECWQPIYRDYMGVLEFMTPNGEPMIWNELAKEGRVGTQATALEHVRDWFAPFAARTRARFRRKRRK